MTPSNSEYNAQYYQKRRNELLDNKRDKYASDPAYREKMIERAKAFRKGKAGEMLAFYKDGGRYLTYAGVAKKLGISVETLKTWIRKEEIPGHDCEIKSLPCFSPWLWRVILQTMKKGQKHYGKARRAANQAVQNAPEGTPKDGSPSHRKRGVNRS